MKRIKHGEQGKIRFTEAESEVAPNKKTVMNVCSVLVFFCRCLFIWFFLIKLFKVTMKH